MPSDEGERVRAARRKVRSIDGKLRRRHEHLRELQIEIDGLSADWSVARIELRAALAERQRFNIERKSADAAD